MDRLSLGEKPRWLSLISLLALLLASLYFYNVLTRVPSEVFDLDALNTFVGFVVWVLLMFYLYVKQLVNTFRLSSGNRKAWRDMTRICLLYIALSGFSMWVGGQSITLAFTFQTNAFLMLMIMVLMTIYLLLPRVRLFFTPSYAEPEGIISWLFFLGGKDPFKGEKLLLV